MADVKISGLPASTTPLAGTEVLPIVQGGQTRQVSVNNLTVGKAVSALSLTATRNTNAQTNMAVVENTADGNVAAAPVFITSGTKSGVLIAYSPLYTTYRQYEANSFLVQANSNNLNLSANGANNVRIYTNDTLRMQVSGAGGVSIGDATDPGAGNLRLGTGNLVIGTSGKGIDFSATPGTGTSELFSDYEEGTFTPTATAQTPGATPPTFTYACFYTKVGRLVQVTGSIFISSAGTASGQINIAGFPFTNGTASFGQLGTAQEQANTGLLYQSRINSNNTTGSINATSGGGVVWLNNYQYIFSIVYFAAA